MDAMELVHFLIGNTSSSTTAQIDGETFNVYHLEGGDFTYEVIARRIDRPGQWEIESARIIKGLVTGMSDGL